jgi:uncharacterized peroxidase-related enzyme
LKDDALAERIEQDWMAAGLDRRRTAMLVYAAKLTRTPGEMTRADVEALRAAGFSDADVLAIAEVVGYYAYVNRIADGLGVELEAEGGGS